MIVSISIINKIVGDIIGNIIQKEVDFILGSARQGNGCTTLKTSSRYIYICIYI